MKSSEKEDWAITKNTGMCFFFFLNKFSNCCLQDVHFNDKMEACVRMNGVLIAFSVGMQVTPGESHFCSITEVTPQIA